MLFLGRAGFEADEILKGTSSTLLLAQAGALDLGSAADIASNVLKGFRLEVEDLNEVVDVLAFTANNSNTNVQQLGQAMSFVAPIAAGLGVSIQETSAAIGSLSDAGIQATRAGTGLTRVLSELESPTAASQKILASLGVTTDEIRVSQVGLTESLKVLRDAGVDTGLALQLFGVRGGPAFEVLQNAIPDIVEMTKELGNVEGVAQRTADIMDMNLNGALLALRSSIQNVVLQFGELSGQSGITSFVRGLTRFVRFLGDNLVELGRAATVVGIALAINFAQRGVDVANAAMVRFSRTLLRNPLGILLVALTGVIAALAFFSDEIAIGGGSLATLSDIATVVFAQISTGFEIFGGVIESVMINVTAIFSNFFKDIDFSFAGLLRLAARVVDTIAGFFIGLGKSIVVIFFEIPNVVGEQIIRAINVIRREFGEFLNGLIADFNKVASAFNLPTIDPVEIEQRINEFEGAGRKFREAIDRSFKEGFEFDFFSSGIEASIAEAEDLARQRAQSAGVTDGGGTSTDETNISTSAQNRIETGSGGIGSGGTNSDFEEFIFQLQQENDLIGLNSKERAIGNGLLSAEFALKRRLGPIEAERVKALTETNIILQDQETVNSFLENLRTENTLLGLNETARGDASAIINLQMGLIDEITISQKQEAEELIKLNRELMDQVEILDSLRRPQEEYARVLAATNKLLKEGRISAEEQNQALRGTELDNALTDIQTSLMSPAEQETARLQLALAERQLVIEQSVEEEIITREEGNALILEDALRVQNLIKEGELDRLSVGLGAASDTFSTLGQLSKTFEGEQSKSARVLFGISKALAIAETTVNIASAIAKAANNPFPLNLVAIASAVAQTAGLISQISSAQVEGGFQTGGEFMVGGSGGADSQTVSFQATPGERVTVETPQQQSAADGSAPQSGQSEGGGVRIINVVDPAMVEGFLTSSDGERVLLNVIERNSGSINATLQA